MLFIEYFIPGGELVQEDPVPEKPSVDVKGPEREQNGPRITVRVVGDKAFQTVTKQGTVDPSSTDEGSKTCNSETSEKEVEGVHGDNSGNKIYYNYQAGTNKVLMNVKVKSDEEVQPEVPAVTDEEVIVISTLPNGSKQLSFRFDQLTSKLDGQRPHLNQVYQHLVKILKDRTNFLSLENREEYLSAVARLLESAYFNVAVDKESQKLFDQLADVLELIDTTPSQSEQKSSSVLYRSYSSQSADLPSYASHDELTENCDEEFEDESSDSDLLNVEKNDSIERGDVSVDSYVEDENNNIKKTSDPSDHSKDELTKQNLSSNQESRTDEVPKSNELNKKDEL